MFAIMGQIFNSKNRDIQKKILFTFAALFIFKIGTVITVPGVNIDPGSLSFLEIVNAMSGGAFENASIFALGVMPYISASIIIQLLSFNVIPYLSELRKQGGTGRQKINQITRVVGLILAFVQGYMYSFAYIQEGTPMDYMLYSLVLTAGTALVLWIGDQITQKGLGNGISLLIMAGIITTLPGMFTGLWNELVVNGENMVGIFTFSLFALAFLAIIIGVIFVEKAERRIPIQYSNKSTSTLGKQNYIPFKLNSAGVLPVIFASAALSLPQMVAAFTNSNQMALFITKWLDFSTPTGLGLFIVMIIGFAYLYTFMQMKPSDLSDNLNKNGGYIPGIRPGVETEKYVTRVLKRITVVGASFLALLAALPILLNMFLTIQTSIVIGGTGLLIVVGVLLETYKQLDSQLVSRSYVKGKKGRR